LTNNQNSDFINLTAKDYHTPKGVASQLHLTKNDDDIYYVKGPMGIGLDLDPNGLNICFTGGTGILVVLDAVAMLAIKLSNSTEEVSQLGKDFKLWMYYTSSSEE